MGLHKWLPNVKRMGLIVFMATLFVFPVENLQAMQGEVVYKMTAHQLQEKFYKTQIDQKISVDIQEATVEEALRQIANRTGLKLTYRGDVIENKMITLTRQEISVTDALHSILEGTGLDYLFSEDGYLLVYASREELTDIEVQQTITGTVFDAETEESLPGVNIVVKGTTTGTATDREGAFNLNVPSLQDTLVFSFIGYQTQEVPINGQTEIDVAMRPLAISGEELVVVGYGVQERRDVTGSVVSVNAEDLQSQRTVPISVDRMLQGQAAGVQVTQSSAEPGGGSRIRIRGAGSINAGNEPLYVIDGVPIDNNPLTTGTQEQSGAGIRNANPPSPLNSLNPNDIASIEILKDASATAIYGSRGANGVILITTKQGVEGDLQVEYSTNVGYQQVAKKIDVLSAQQYMSVLNELESAQGNPPMFSSEQMAAVGEGRDWQDRIFEGALMQSHQLSVAGGTEDLQYYTSVNFNNQEGIIKNSGIQRFQGRVNLNYDKDKLSLGVNLTTSLVKNDIAPNGIGGIGPIAGIVYTSLYQDPTMPVRDEEGNFVRSTTTQFGNPVALAEIDDQEQTDRTLARLFAEYDVLDNLSARINVGSDTRGSRRNAYNPTLTDRGEDAGGIANVSDVRATNYLVEGTLNYQNDFSTRFNLKLLGGVTYQEFTTENLNGVAQGFPSDGFRTYSLQTGSNVTNAAATAKSQHQLLSYLARANLRYDSKYLLTVTFRADGSSRFGEGNKYGYFPSVALGWRLSEEEFMNRAKVLTNLKLRASYGITGNEAIGNYTSLSLLGFGGQALLGNNLVSGIAPIQIANPDLKWEKTSEFDIGLDFEFWEGRLGGSIDYYIRETSDLLLNLPIPITSGFETSLQNVGEVQNKGVEFEVHYSSNSTRNFVWSSSFNFSTVQNEVKDLGPLQQIRQGHPWLFFPDFTVIQEGDPLNAYYGYEVGGVFQTNDDIANSAQPLAKPGDLKFKDINGDGQITPADQKVLGSPFPDATFGWRNNFSYKNFNLNIFVNASLGNEVYNGNATDSFYPPSFRRNRIADHYLNRWTPDNPTNEYPSFIPPHFPSGGDINNSLSVQDASYIRIQNVMLKYNIPTGPGSILRNASVYVSGENLLTITGYEGFNPDVSSFGDSNIVLDYNAYPLARVYSLGVNLKF